LLSFLLLLNPLVASSSPDNAPHPHPQVMMMGGADSWLTHAWTMGCGIVSGILERSDIWELIFGWIIAKSNRK
jgi:hypothetical protein